MYVCMYVCRDRQEFDAAAYAKAGPWAKPAVHVFADCPRQAKVSPSSGPYKPGDILTCEADGYPEPSYQWTVGDGIVVSNGPTIFLTGPVFTLTCTATGSLSDTCSASVVVSSTGRLYGLSVREPLCVCIVCRGWTRATRCLTRICCTLSVID